jgi:hypothetical protein
MSKVTKVLSLLGKLEEAADKDVAKKVKEVKKDSISKERVFDYLNETLDENPNFLDSLDEDEYYDLMDSIPKIEAAKIMGDDTQVEMLLENQRLANQLEPKEAAKSLELFEGAGEVAGYLSKLDAKGLKEFKESVSSEDAELYQEALERLTKLGPRAKKAEGGHTDSKFKVKYAEGSMAMPPELTEGEEEETEAPVDTYDNIPEEEKAEVEASQLPDDEMQKEYFEHTLDKALPNEEDQEYLAAMLQKDSKLSDIFDDIMEKAFEFSGEGKVEGPGTGTSDSIPARLSDGEFVFTRKATDQIGADKLQTMMDNAERAYDGGLMKKAIGGKIEEPLDSEKKRKEGVMYDTTAEEQLKKQMLAANRAPSLFTPR